MTVPTEPVTLGLDVDGTIFRRDEGLARHAALLMGRFNELYPIREAFTNGGLAFGFLYNLKAFDVLTERFVCGSIGKAMKAGAVWRDLTGLDAVLWIRAQTWTLFDEKTRDALLLHQLLHFDATFKNGTWRLATRDHDFAGFNDVARHFGDALPDIGSFVAALKRGEKPLGEAIADEFERKVNAGELDDPASGTVVTMHRRSRSRVTKTASGADEAHVAEQERMADELPSDASDTYGGARYHDEPLDAFLARMEGEPGYQEFIGSDAGQRLLADVARLRRGGGAPEAAS